MNGEDPLFLTWDYTNPRTQRELWLDMADNLASLSVYHGLNLERIIGQICVKVAQLRPKKITKALSDDDIPF